MRPSSSISRCSSLVFLARLGVVLSILAAQAGLAQNFDFEHLQQQVSTYTVVVEIEIEISFGTQSNEHKQRLLGTVVTPDGMVLFDGGLLQEESPFVPSLGFSFRSTPKKVEVVTLDEERFDADYLGVDRYTGLGFAQIVGSDRTFEPVRFEAVDEFRIGDWLAVYALLPEYVVPPLTADIGMISTLVTTPEEFPLTVGFSPLEFASVLFDEQLRPVGILGELTDPTRSGPDPGGAMESFDQGEFPLLGVITADRLQRLIADPPRRGRVDRSWLGITMQALTPDIADFLEISTPGGIIVNEVVPGSPADSCGLLVGDVIYSVNDQRIGVDREEELAVFQRLVSSMGPGVSVELGLFRPGDHRLDTLRLLAVLQAAPLAASDAEDYESETLELTVRDLVFSDFLNFNVEQGSLSGVVVAELRPGGLANISGLRPGDVIQRVNDQAVDSVADFSLLLADIESERPSEVVFFVWRFGQTMFVNVRTDWL